MPTGAIKVPSGWPRSGNVDFNGVVMKYAPHLPPALRGVSFKIKSGEKVGAAAGCCCCAPCACSAASQCPVPVCRLFCACSGRGLCCVPPVCLPPCLLTFVLPLPLPPTPTRRWASSAAPAPASPPCCWRSTACSIWRAAR